VFATVLLILNTIIFRDITPGNLLFPIVNVRYFCSDQFDNRQLAFDSVSETHALWKAFECIGCRRAFLNPTRGVADDPAGARYSNWLLDRSLFMNTSRLQSSRCFQPAPTHS
jgi:hypothetical protein